MITRSPQAGEGARDGEEGRKNEQIEGGKRDGTEDKLRV